LWSTPRHEYGGWAEHYAVEVVGNVRLVRDSPPLPRPLRVPTPAGAPPPVAAARLSAFPPSSFSAFKICGGLTFILELVLHRDHIGNTSPSIARSPRLARPETSLVRGAGDDAAHRILRSPTTVVRGVIRADATAVDHERDRQVRPAHAPRTPTLTVPRHYPTAGSTLALAHGKVAGKRGRQPARSGIGPRVGPALCRRRASVTIADVNVDGARADVSRIVDGDGGDRALPSPSNGTWRDERSVQGSSHRRARPTFPSTPVLLQRRDRHERRTRGSRLALDRTWEVPPSCRSTRSAVSPGCSSEARVPAPLVAQAPDHTRRRAYAVSKHAVVALAGWIRSPTATARIRVACASPGRGTPRCAGAFRPRRGHRSCSRDCPRARSTSRRSWVAASPRAVSCSCQHPSASANFQRKSNDTTEWLRGGSGSHTQCRHALLATRLTHSGPVLLRSRPTLPSALSIA